MREFVQPSDEEMDDILQSLVASDALSKSERARALLTYLIEQTKLGNQRLLKGFSIAMDVFGRDENFDSNNDALVRVHMGRLRDLIGVYYEEEGSADVLRLSIPKGSYVPKFYNAETQIVETVNAEADFDESSSHFNAEEDETELPEAVGQNISDRKIHGGAAQHSNVVPFSPQRVENPAGAKLPATDYARELSEREELPDGSSSKRSGGGGSGAGGNGGGGGSDAGGSNEENLVSLVRRLNFILGLVFLVGLAILAAILFPGVWRESEMIAAAPSQKPVDHGISIERQPNDTAKRYIRNQRGLRGAELLPRITFTHHQGHAFLDSGADKFSTSLRSALSTFDTIQLVSNGPIVSTNAPPEVGARYYSIVMYLLDDDPNFTHRLELRHPATGVVLWSHLLDANSFSKSGTQDKTTVIDEGLTQIASRIAAMDGLLVSHFVNEAGSNRLFDCLTNVSTISRDLPASSSKAAIQCLGRLIASGNRLPLVHGYQALAIVEQARIGVAGLPSSRDFVGEIVEEAMEVTRQGMTYAPENGSLFVLLAELTLLQTGDLVTANQMADDALQRAPYDWTLWSARARLLAKAGRYVEADTMLTTLEKLSGKVQPAWAFTHFLSAIGQDNDEKIQFWASRLGGISNPYYYYARLVAADLGNKDAVKARLENRLSKSFPIFKENVSHFLGAMRVQPQLFEKLLIKASNAGLIEYN